MSRPCAGDWLRLGDGSRVRLGMLVYHRKDPRHIGTLDGYQNSNWAEITWIETGWRSLDLRLRDLCAAPRE